MPPNVTIVGGGPAAMMLAASLDPHKYTVTVFEKNAAPGRKFLVAGMGGFNLTHSEPLSIFLSRYTPQGFLDQSVTSFSNTDLVNWLRSIGIETYTGSSGRIFPLKGIKPIEVLNAILRLLESRKVKMVMNHEWTGFADTGKLKFTAGGTIHEVDTDIVVFAIGGASWPVTGSTGDWKTKFELKNINVKPFQPSNCGYHISWPQSVIDTVEGRALKNVYFSCGSCTNSGEAVITKAGLEGSGIYPLSPAIREELETYGSAILSIDLKPSFELERIHAAFSNAKGNVSERLRNDLRLGDAALALLKAYLTRDEFLGAETLSKKIKSFPLQITGTAPMAEAISTVGGIALHELTEFFEIKKLPRHYAIGEMLDYDAPTGGYLLQSCFSMGHFLATHLNTQML